jgi:hypothetical protein
VANKTRSQAPPAPAAKKNGFLATVRKIRNEKTGLLPLAIVAIACAIVVIPLYKFLGLPALYLSNVFLSMSCGTNGWICGAWLAILAGSGPIVIGVLLLVFRTQVRKLLAKTKIPLDFDFLVVPLLATIFFTMGWAGIAFHFFDREGLVLDGYFPIVFGMIIFALGRWGGAIKDAAAGLFAPREMIPAKFRVLALFGGVVLLGWILGPIHAPQRDQIVAVLALLLGWWMFTVVPRSELAVKPRPAPTTLWAWLSLAILGIIAALAERVLAQPCIHDTKMDYFDCEQAHHNGTAAGTAGSVGVIAAGTATLLSSDATKSRDWEKEAHDAHLRGLTDEERRAEREERDQKAAHDAHVRGLTDQERRDERKAQELKERMDKVVRDYAALTPDEKAKLEREQKRASEEREEKELDEARLEAETFLIFAGVEVVSKPANTGPISREEALRRLIDRGELPPSAADPDAEPSTWNKVGRFIQGIPYDWTIQKGVDTVRQTVKDANKGLQDLEEFNKFQKGTGNLLPEASVLLKADNTPSRPETTEEIRKRLRESGEFGKQG